MFTFEKPLKGISKNYWIGLKITETQLMPLLYLKPSKYHKKYMKELELILNRIKSEILTKDYI